MSHDDAIKATAGEQDYLTEAAGLPSPASPRTVWSEYRSSRRWTDVGMARRVRCTSSISMSAYSVSCDTAGGQQPNETTRQLQGKTSTRATRPVSPQPDQQALARCQQRPAIVTQARQQDTAQASPPGCPPGQPDPTSPTTTQERNVRGPAPGHANALDPARPRRAHPPTAPPPSSAPRPRSHSHPRRPHPPPTLGSKPPRSTARPKPVRAAGAPSARAPSSN